MKNAKERSIFFAILCCCSITVIVMLLIAIPFSYYIYETYFICMGDPPATPGLIREWDGEKRFAGLIVKYRCKDSNEVVQIVDCVTGEWKIVMKKSGLCTETTGQSMDCPDDPPQLPGMTRMWNGHSRAIGTTVTYICKQDVEQDRVVFMVCTEFVWKVTYEKIKSCEELMQHRRCSGDPFPSDTYNPSNWDNKTRDVGTKINFYCNDHPDSLIMRTVICSKNYQWHVVSDTKEKCLCGNPVLYPTPLQYDWDGKSLHSGVVVKYGCITPGGIVNFMSIKCSYDSKWLVTENGSCTYLVDKQRNFSQAVQYCEMLDSEIVVPRTSSALESFIFLLREAKTLGSACNRKVFVGIRENSAKQWNMQFDNDTFVSHNSEMWHQVDEGRAHCAAMHRSAEWKLNNVLCSGIRCCAMCEVDASSTSNEKVCPTTSKKCYVPLIAHQQDFKAHSKECSNLGGKLAAPTTYSMLQTLIEVVKKNETVAKDCNWIYVGLVHNKRYYETLHGEEMQFDNHKIGTFVSDRYRSMGRHCVVSHEKNRFEYVDELCTLNSCFVCSITGPPIGSEVKAHVNKQLLIHERSEMGIMPRELSATSNCKENWTTDGIGCYLFNETHVTESEARETCRSEMTDLASIGIPMDRQFISHYLRRHYVKTENLMWHVEIPEGFLDEYDVEQTIVDYDTNCTVIHLLPEYGWSFMDCNTKAAFICRD